MGEGDVIELVQAVLGVRPLGVERMVIGRS
jgi:hypothetical protein